MHVFNSFVMCLWTWPTGGALNEEIECMFHDRQIEDLWIPYFCVTTDISNPSMRIHTSGKLDWRCERLWIKEKEVYRSCDFVFWSLWLNAAFRKGVFKLVMHTLQYCLLFGPCVLVIQWRHWRHATVVLCLALQGRKQAKLQKICPRNKTTQNDFIWLLKINSSILCSLCHLYRWSGVATTSTSPTHFLCHLYD